MGYQPQTRSPRTSSRRREKGKAKAKEQKHRSTYSNIFEEEHVPTSAEVAEKTLTQLHNLGNQRFAVPPFNIHFNRWMTNLRDVLSEFESSSVISIDDLFVTERSQTLTSIELKLEEKRRKEASNEEAVKSLADTTLLLKRIEDEYADKTKQIKREKNSEINRLTNNVDSLRAELAHMEQTKKSILAAILKKGRIQKEAELTQRLNSAEKALTSAKQHFTDEQEKLRDEYEKGKQPTIKQMLDQQKQIESQEIDDSLEDRRVACETLANAVNALLQRSLREKDSA